MSFQRLLGCSRCYDEDESCHLGTPDELLSEAIYYSAVQRLWTLQGLVKDADCWEDVRSLEIELECQNRWLKLLDTAHNAAYPGTSTFASNLPVPSPGMRAFQEWLTRRPPSPLVSRISLCEVKTDYNRVWHKFPLLSVRHLLSHFRVLADSDSGISVLICIEDFTPVNVSFLGMWLELPSSYFLRHLRRELSVIEPVGHLGYGLDVVADAVAPMWPDTELGLLHESGFPLQVHHSPVSSCQSIPGLDRLEFDEASDEHFREMYKAKAPSQYSEEVFSKYAVKECQGTTGVTAYNTRERAFHRVYTSYLVLTEMAFITLKCTPTSSGNVGVVFGPCIPSHTSLKFLHHAKTGRVGSLRSFLESCRHGPTYLPRDFPELMDVLALFSAMMATNCLQLITAQEHHALECMHTTKDDLGELGFFEAMTSRVMTIRERLIDLEHLLQNPHVDLSHHRRMVTRLQRSLRTGDDLIKQKRNFYITTQQSNTNERSEDCYTTSFNRPPSHNRGIYLSLLRVFLASLV